MRLPYTAGLGTMLLVFCVLSLPLQAQEAGDDHLRALSTLALYAPEDARDSTYLGLKGSPGKISLGQINAEVLIVEIFSMYCPHCQKHAPDARKLYQVIDSTEEFRDRIKMIGIGVGNSRYEVAIFKEKYSPPFPLFDDRDSAVLNAVSGIYTPHYFGLRIRDDSTLEMFYSKSGAFPDAEAFFDMIVKESGIRRGGKP